MVVEMVFTAFVAMRKTRKKIENMLRTKRMLSSHVKAYPLLESRCWANAQSTLQRETVHKLRS